jgi:hypothetical protein
MKKRKARGQPIVDGDDEEDAFVGDLNDADDDDGKGVQRLIKV